MLTQDNVLISARNGCTFDHLDETEEVIAYLPLAWVGDHIFSYAQSIVAGFCVNCPESPDTVVEDRREIGTDLLLRAAARVREPADAASWCAWRTPAALKRRMFHYFIGVAKRCGEKILNGERVPLGDRLLYGLGEVLVYAPLKNRSASRACASPIRRARRSARSCSVLPLARHQPEAALRPDRSLASTSPCSPTARSAPTPSGRPGPTSKCSIAEDGEVLFKSPGVFQAYYKDPEADRRAPRRRTAGCIPAMPASSTRPAT